MNWHARITNGPHAGRTFELLELPRFIRIEDDCACCGREHPVAQDPDAVPAGPVYELFERTIHGVWDASSDVRGGAAYRLQMGERGLHDLLANTVVRAPTPFAASSPS